MNQCANPLIVSQLMDNWEVLKLYKTMPSPKGKGLCGHSFQIVVNLAFP